MITYLLPTRDRPGVLRRTLDALGRLDARAHEALGGAEVIVVDNASTTPAQAEPHLSNGFPCRVIRLPTNHGAAARNIAASEAQGEWIIMLDDDSYPLDCGHIDALIDAPPDVAAIGAEILLPDGSHEAGGLPEVFIGCGVAIRREAFRSGGGYDAAFDYYAEEYDLCAKLLRDGWRIVHDFRFRALHEKVAAHRDMNRILHRLVRNNCWVMQRYAPPQLRSNFVHQTIARYAQIALKEHAACGFAQGMAETLQTLAHQPDRAMSPELFARFTGATHAVRTLSQCDLLVPGVRAAIVAEGKNSWTVRDALDEFGVSIVPTSQADVLVIATLSPGPIVEALDRFGNQQKSVIAPWLPSHLTSPKRDPARVTSQHQFHAVDQVQVLHPSDREQNQHEQLHP